MKEMSPATAITKSPNILHNNTAKTVLIVTVVLCVVLCVEGVMTLHSLVT
jgi:hypothetical protein